jgi:deazaflavin-dependent oxidoreductase (nitroreductase family)
MSAVSAFGADLGGLDFHRPRPGSPQQGRCLRCTSRFPSAALIRSWLGPQRRESIYASKLDILGQPLLLLTMIGAKTGRTLVRPLCYSRDGHRLVIIASRGGDPRNPPWYYNLVANPVVIVEVGTEKFKAKLRKSMALSAIASSPRRPSGCRSSRSIRTRPSARSLY